MPLYSFHCSRHHVTESIRSMIVDVIACPVCDSPAVRDAANRVAVTLPEVDIRGKFRRFVNASEEMNHAAERIEQTTGQTVRTPNYWHRALAQAQEMNARGESPKVHKEQLG